MASTIVILAALTLSLSFAHGQLQPGLEGIEDSSNVEPFLLFSDWIGIAKIDLDGSRHSRVLLDDKGVLALDYHYRRNTIYYLTASYPTLMSHPLSQEQPAVGEAGNRPTRLKTAGMHEPSGIAVDWVNDKVYWTDKLKKTIEVFDIVAEEFSTVLTLDEIPQGLSIFPYPNDTYLFVTTRDDAHSSALYRVKADGSEKVAISPSADVSVMDICATASTIDRGKCKLSWINECGNMVEEAQLDGSSPHTLLENVGHSAGLEQYKNDYYYAQRDTLYKDRSGSGKVSIYTKRQVTLMGVTVVHPSKQPEANELLPIDECHCEPGFRNPKCQDVNECESSTHDCEQGCENTEGSYLCTCQPGFTLRTDQRTCQELPPTTVTPATEEVTTPTSTVASASTTLARATTTPPPPTTMASTTLQTTQAEATTLLQATTNPPSTTLSTTLQTTQPQESTTALSTDPPTKQPPTKQPPSRQPPTTPVPAERSMTTGSGVNSIKTTALPEARATTAIQGHGDGGGLNSLTPEGPSSGVLIVICISVVVFLVLTVASVSYLFLVVFKYYKKRRGSYNVRKRGGKRGSMDPLTRISYRSYIDYQPSTRPATDNPQSRLMGSLSVESFERMSVGSPFFVPPRPSPAPSVQSNQPARILVTEAEIPPPAMAEFVNLDLLESRMPSDTLRTVYSTDEREMYFSL